MSWHQEELNRASEHQETAEAEILRAYCQTKPPQAPELPQRRMQHYEQDIEHQAHRLPACHHADSAWSQDTNPA